MNRRPRGFTNPRCDVDVRPGGAVRIEAVGVKTRRTLRASATSPAAKHLDGMNQGWSETLDRLGEEVAHLNECRRYRVQ
jgi:hypothetical protein